MTLRSRCILTPREAKDGVRLSIMSRHTLSDGATPHPEISDDLFDEHITDLAPPPKLVGKWYRNELGYQNEITFNREFAPRYLEHIRSDKIEPIVFALAKSSLEDSVTVLCIESTPEKCHRRLLLEECQRVQPELEVDIQ